MVILFYIITLIETIKMTMKIVMDDLICNNLKLTLIMIEDRLIIMKIMIFGYIPLTNS